MNKILILDYGSQYTQLIARRIREEHVYCEIQPCTWTYDQIVAFNPKGIVLSGGPASVLAKGSPKIDKRVFDLDIPILGICYGMQLMTHLLGGKITPSKKREYGRSEMIVEKDSPLFAAVKLRSVAWMSHGDSIKSLPKGFEQLAVTENKIIAAMGNTLQKRYAVQFHPEVVHTQEGQRLIKNFLFHICQVKPDWTMSSFINDSLEKIRTQVGNDRVILGLSGGVDSSVAAILINKAVGKALTCIFIDNGLLRKNEAKKVRDMYGKHYKLKLIFVDASKIFLKALKGVSDPERKRKIIGRVFIEVFDKEAKKIKNAKFLAQGTLYPDVIESVSFKGPSAVIKSHHNVGGLPKKMGLKLVEPLRELFKDEVRLVGKEMEMPAEVLGRHPFPGPGLAIRIIGSITEERLRILRDCDAIVLEEIRNAGIYNQLWQAFAVLLPVKSVGVMGDERTYENVCCVRVVTSLDGMTADWADLPRPVLEKISSRIINEVKGINRVVYDISSKPPATIEWE